MITIEQAEDVCRQAEAKINQLSREIDQLAGLRAEAKEDSKELKQQAVRETLDHDGQIVDAAQARAKAEKRKIEAMDAKSDIKQLQRDKSQLEADLRVLQSELSSAQKQMARLSSAISKVTGQL